MPLQSPVVRDLSLWNSRVSKSVWEISTPEKNSLYWSIIISYLIPSAHSQSTSNFAKRLKNLTDGSGGSQEVMDQLKNFNPFKKKHAFHFGKDMTGVLQIFKKKINRSTNNRPFGADVQGMKLDAASKMLNCFIEVYSIDSNGTKNHCIYSPNSQSINSSVNLDTIIIFHHPNTQLKNREKDTFGFGMEFQNAQSSQEKALTFLLRKDKLLKENNAQIQQSVRNSENFLISLLNSDVKNVIPRIYKSPYILAKLQNAGYNTNPLVKGRDGFSAFHLCLSLPDSQYLNILYNYVSNNFYQSSESCRNPSDETVKSLNDLKRAFEADFENSNGFSSLPPIAVQRYRQILRFNEYQANVVKIMKNSQQKSADSIFLSILQEYINYFLFCSLPNDEGLQFENYLIFSDYYENLDRYTSVLLLDRLLSVKNKAFSDLVKSLFLMVMSNNYFPGKEHNHDDDTPLGCKGCAHRLIPFRSRMNFLKVMREGFDKVQTGSAGNNASPDCMILRNVQSIPKDEFLLARLKTSLETAINAEVNDKKGVLTILRTIQVFGEVFATSITENFVSGFLLSAHIPEHIELALLDIRNDISHYKANAIEGRLNLETRIDLLQKIQDELKLIYQVLEPVFSCQQFKMKEFIIQSAAPHFQISEEELKNIATEREIWCKAEWGQFKSFAVNVFRLFAKVLNKLEPKMNDSKNYFHKIKRLQNGAEALNFVFSFKITSDDPIVAKHLTDARSELQKIIKSLEERELIDDDINDLHNSYQKYVLLLKQVFDLEVKDTDSELKCKYLIYFKENLKDYNVFVEEENLKIRKLISEFLEPSFEATLKLKTALKNPQSLTNIDQVLNQTYLSSKNRKIIKDAILPKQLENLKISKNVNKNNPDKTLDKKRKPPKSPEEVLKNFSYESQKQALGEENETSEKLLEMLTKEEYKVALLQHSSTFEKSLEIKFLKLVNQKMEFLIERINVIERVLIDEEDNIRDLVKWGRSPEIKKHNKFLMRQRYVMELDVKSSLEMLLFDCMNIMHERKDLENIYTKMNDMFAGVDLRNILSHGNILVDSLGTFLDPDDLPSELITKMLELIDDKKALEALSNLWMKEKPMTTKHLKELIKKQSGSQTIADIIKCLRWEGYAVILPTRQ
ncbi:hypothetical protein AVEN_215165-1 [Araneus ventricosus]|uniref:Uncharacterized protein n=1 Tax=Araneus ventricosus TaxID=182803 RepID=A0A4Y2FPD1_ARAVE|nr:hypothetical protein AVEN_215165-1 [Araneus ventricosus]